MKIRLGVLWGKDGQKAHGREYHITDINVISPHLKQCISLKINLQSGDKGGYLALSLLFSPQSGTTN